MGGTDRKWRCKECGWVGRTHEYLVARNPFDPSDKLVGCPKCRQPSTLYAACDEPGCKEMSSQGWPTGDGGYRHTCHRHGPEAT